MKKLLIIIITCLTLNVKGQKSPGFKVKEDVKRSFNVAVGKPCLSLPKIDPTTWTDTIQVKLLVSDTCTFICFDGDTISYNIDSRVYSIKAYSVRNWHYEFVEEYNNPNKVVYHGQGVYSSTAIGGGWVNIKRAVNKHSHYLSYNKEPLNPCLLIWQVR